MKGLVKKDAYQMPDTTDVDAMLIAKLSYLGPVTTFGFLIDSYWAKPHKLFCKVLFFLKTKYIEL